MVQLSGFVRSQADMDTVVQVARWAAGAETLPPSVRDELYGDFGPGSPEEAGSATATADALVLS